MDNEFLTRKDLSLKAKGLLACMLCLPPDWRFSIEGLAYINKESEMFTVQTTALNQDGGCRESTYLVSG